MTGPTRRSGRSTGPTRPDPTRLQLFDRPRRRLCHATYGCDRPEGSARSCASPPPGKWGIVRNDAFARQVGTQANDFGSHAATQVAFEPGSVLAIVLARSRRLAEVTEKISCADEAPSNRTPEVPAEAGGNEWTDLNPLLSFDGASPGSEQAVALATDRPPAVIYTCTPAKGEAHGSQQEGVLGGVPLRR
jgi:hypothetical protein